MPAAGWLSTTTGEDRGEDQRRQRRRRAADDGDDQTMITGDSGEDGDDDGDHTDDHTTAARPVAESAWIGCGFVKALRNIRTLY